MDFKGITGQKDVISRLTGSIINDRVGHAYIFSGPAGIGKRTVARIFADILLCEKKDPYHSCGECLPCRLSAEGSNPDFIVIQAENASIGIDEARKVQSGVTVRPLYSGRKVYLIIDAEKMTAQAQNCLLKTLEEPPGYAVIILTVSNTDTLIETIRSRAVELNFRKNTPDEIRDFLEHRYDGALKDAAFIASYADGVIGAALELAESEEFSSVREQTVRMLERLKSSTLCSVFGMYEFFEKNRDSFDGILDIMTLLYRDMLAFKVSGNENILINSDKKDIIVRNAAQYTVRKLTENIEAIEAARRSIKQNVNYQLSIEVMLMKLREEDN